jgi:hypothetical protein
MPYKDNIKRKKYIKQWRIDNIDYCRLKDHEYYLKNKDKIIIKVLNYRENNKDRLNVAAKKRYWKEIDKNRLRVCRYMKDRKLKDPKFRLKQTMGTSIYKAIKNNKEGKSWQSFLDYTVEDLRKHLEKQFHPGMTWNNYGKAGWEIDHIIPISVFNFEKPEDIDFKRCWALKNLQPMWAKENDSKNNKLLKPFQPSFVFNGRRQTNTTS